MEKAELQRELVRVNKDLNEANQRNLALTQHTQMDDLLMQGLKTRMETAEGELERLKRKRADSNSPVRTVTSILKRPASPSVTEPLPPATNMDILSSSAKPTPKRSRTRRERWKDVAKEHGQHMHSSSEPPTSSNQDGGKDKKEHTSLAKRKDLVLRGTPYS